MKARSPSFLGLKAASPASSFAKKMNRGQDTTHERTLRKLLWRAAYAIARMSRHFRESQTLFSSSQSCCILRRGFLARKALAATVKKAERRRKSVLLAAKD